MAGTFNQSLQCTQDVFVDFQAPSPPVAGTGENTPLALRHEEAFHGSRPDLVVWAREDGHKGSEAGQHISC